MFKPSKPIPHAVVENTKQTRGWFSNFWTKIWNEVKTIAADVTTVVTDVWKVIDVLATGSYEGNYNHTLAQFSFSNSTSFEYGYVCFYLPQFSILLYL
jgi:hypothetical protein